MGCDQDTWGEGLIALKRKLCLEKYGKKEKRHLNTFSCCCQDQLS